MPSSPDKLKYVLDLCSKDSEMQAIYANIETNDIHVIYDLLTNLEDLKSRMQNDVVHFSFTKKDGTLRQAYGTRSKDIISRHGAEPGQNPAAKRKATSSGFTFPYFDIEKREWRCFTVKLFEGIDNGYAL